jgi:hypothetical protein
MISAFFTLLWRRLDTLEKKMDTDGVKLTTKIDAVDTKLNALIGDFREFKGRTEALLGIKPVPVPVEKVPA